VFLVRLVINFVALLTVFLVVWNVTGFEAIVTAVGMTVIMAVVNAFIRPVVILSTLGTSILVMSIFGLLINLLLFYVAALVVGIHVPFWQAALGWAVFSIIATALNKIAIYEW
jgi:putative membrane protein